MQVLVIGGEPALRELVAGMLERAGHAVDEVDLVLCDIELRDGDGEVGDLLRNSRAAGVDTAFLMVKTSGAGSLRQQLRALEAQIIARALRQANHDRRVAAERLGIGLSSLYRKLDEFERLWVA